ncbi:hypothetical protein DSM3645_13530 [Blastopirellula marina DSM 3645]|uniref:Uncharacterized protein n=1 Tax=Blastopirellula marina DSM 3645 TaxID=314230 RepID=A3ZWL4_9BACT|nr:hypothetical protein DSM3645_13530 [Blastopirellula marina DSM 3645]
MGNGRPHDHPLTDLLVHKMHPFPEQVEALILKLTGINPGALANTDHLLSDWERGTERGIAWLEQKLREQDCDL